MSNQNFNFDDAFGFADMDNTAEAVAETATETKEQSGSSFDFDELFDSFKEAEVEAVASTPVVPTNVSTSKKEKTNQGNCDGLRQKGYRQRRNVCKEDRNDF